MSNNKMAVEVFKSSVVRIRDILRGPGISITGMDGMRHISLYIMSRFLTKDKTDYIGIPEKFSWENIMELTKHKDPNVVLELFYHDSQDNLVFNLDKLFETRKFSFDIKHPQKHKEILEILDKIKIDDVDCEIDILGWVYEQHLKTGAGAARDLGQFFTDRFICNYMTELCKPKCKAEGVPESMCDPTMGTGGFITSYIKYFKNMTIDWKVQQKEIFGCDTDPKVVGISCMNAFMETKGKARFENLKEQDSLYKDLIRNGYDVILANMPFGLKGIKYADCCNRVKDLKINGTFFMNTGIQPSIIFFEKSGYSTGTVEFWEKDEFKEIMVASVSRDKFDDSCSFDMRKYMESDKLVMNPTGFPMVKLGDIIEIIGGKRRTVQEETTDGEFDFITCSIMGKSQINVADFDKPAIIINAINGSGRCRPYYSEKYSTTTNNIHFSLKDKSKNVDLKYLHRYLELNSKLLEDGFNGGNQKKINQEYIKTIQVIIPPLPIQQEIVATLDRIYTPGTTELVDTIKMTDKAMDLVLANPSGATLEPIVEAQRLIRKSAQMVADVKAQMMADVKAQIMAIMKSIEYRGFEKKNLGDLINMSKGKLQATKCDGGEYPVVSISNKWTHSIYSDEGEHVYIASTSSGTSSGPFETVVKYYNGKCSSTTLMQRLDIKNINKISYRYLYYALNYIKEMIQSMCEKGSCNKTLNIERFLDLQIVVPPLDIQNNILIRLEALQSQLTALESLQKQSEDNAKFILESYLSSSSIETNVSEIKETLFPGSVASKEGSNIEIPDDI
jgi:restriction endonuclease S subunit